MNNGYTPKTTQSNNKHSLDINWVGMVRGNDIEEIMKNKQPDIVERMPEEKILKLSTLNNPSTIEQKPILKIIEFTAKAFKGGHEVPTSTATCKASFLPEDFRHESELKPNKDKSVFKGIIFNKQLYDIWVKKKEFKSGPTPSFSITFCGGVTFIYTLSSLD